jgi:hypothetical protein
MYRLSLAMQTHTFGKGRICAHWSISTARFVDQGVSHER